MDGRTMELNGVGDSKVDGLQADIGLGITNTIKAPA